nr:MAG TPA: hypothetical protein [Caudoviricetes sp.]
MRLSRYMAYGMLMKIRTLLSGIQINRFLT